MRLDIRDPRDVPQATKAKAYLDGVFVPACVMADEEAGVVECYEVNEQGRVIAGADEEPRLICKSGQVKIELGT